MAVQSPAFALIFDRKGALEDIFQDFATAAGRAGQGVSCLRAQSTVTLNVANSAVQANTSVGSFAYGPSADGNFVRQLAVWSSSLATTGREYLLSSFLTLKPKLRRVPTPFPANLGPVSH